MEENYNDTEELRELQELQDKNKKKRKRVILISAITAFTLISIFFWAYIFEGLPSLEQLENPKPILASKVYSDDGELVGQFFIENRIESSIDSLPPHLIQALIATEDRKFYDHWGVDLDRIVKAMVKNVFSLSWGEGASTLTQQLAKNLYSLKAKNESKFETIVRKIREWITAIQIEKNYTKNEILEMYLNVSFFGRSAYGVETASNIYFNKRARDLNIQEAAVLVGLLKSHVYYDPVRRYDRALVRRNLVMFNMVEVGYLKREKYEHLKNMPIEIAQERITNLAGIAPHFLEYVRQQMTQLAEQEGFDLYKEGLSIQTTLDSRMQRIANRVVKEHITEYQAQFDKYWKWEKHTDLLNSILDRAIKDNPKYKLALNTADKSKIYNTLKNSKTFVDSIKRVAQTIQTGFVAIDPTNGHILAMVGGENQKFSYGLNHVTQILRQPGSSFKPIIYSVAIDKGLYPAYPLLNQPFMTADGWSPKNFDTTYGANTTLRDALRRSLNVITAKLIVEGYAPLDQIGLFAKRMGVNSKLELYPSIALGTSLVTPLEITSAYATLANKGVYNSPSSILRVEDNNGMIVKQFIPERREALSEETAYIMTNMMQSVVDRGTAAGIRSRFGFYRPAAGKTGTTQEYADAWFIGFTPQIVAGVWVGFDDHRIKFTGSYGQGGRAAMPIWAKFMAEVYKELEAELPLVYFERPEEVVTAEFCSESVAIGRPKLATQNCPYKIYDIINVKDMPSFCTTPKEAHYFEYGSVEEE